MQGDSGAGSHPERQVPAWALVAAPAHHGLVGASVGAASLSPALVGSRGQRDRKLVSVLPRKAHLLLASAPAPSWGPTPWPASFSVLILQSCTRRELSMGGWFFGFCFSLVYLFNLMICKVMFLFLFYTLQLIFNLCLENDSCNCTFFFFFWPPNNNNNKLAILC